MYQVLYRKWRPQTFADVAGQSHITEALAREVETDRVSHAYLFTGSRGTGKTTCAKILAKAVNCLHPVNGNPCNECEVCKGIDDGSILDVIEIDAASNNGVDNIRDLRDEANYTPVHTKYRIYIIDEVHMLSIGAFNALLITLEEPPEHVKFILATTEVHKLPATILSRCQRFDFHRITPESIVSRLFYVAGQEGIELEQDAAYLISRIADGALRDALSVLDRCSAIDNHVTVEIVSSATGLANKDYLFNLVENICLINPSESVNLVDSLYCGGCDMERLCGELINHYRNLMIIKTVKNAQSLIVCTDADFERYKEQADKINLSKILYSVAELESCASILKNSDSKRTQMEMSVIKICIPEISTDNTAIISRIEALERKIKNLSSGSITAKQPETEEKPEQEEKKPVPVKTEPSPAVPENSNQAQTSEDDAAFSAWGEVIENLNLTDKPLTGILSSSSAYVRNDFLLIKCDNPVFSQFIRQSNHASAIKKAVFDVTGKKYRLGIYKGEEKKENVRDPLADLIKKINN